MLSKIIKKTIIVFSNNSLSYPIISENDIFSGMYIILKIIIKKIKTLLKKKVNFEYGEI